VVSLFEMTLYYSIVFIVLIFEMLLFLVLVAPLPASVHSKMIKGMRTSVATNIVRSLKFLFVFILVLFIDSVQRVSKVPELDTGAQLTVADRSDYIARKFYNQRNMYLCGFTLFLSLILNRTYTLVKHNSDLRMQLGSDGKGVSLAAEDYKERLERKKKQYKGLEAQTESLQKEYYKVCDELKTLKGQQRTSKQD